MRLDGRIKSELRQTRRLGQTVQQALQLVCLGPGDLLDTLESEAEGNPFLRVLPPHRSVSSGAVRPGPSIAEPEANTPGLVEHVLRQVNGLVAQKDDRRLAMALIEELDATGYLVEGLSQIAYRCGVPIGRLETVLQQMRRAEPAGLFARDLADCLALQLEDRGVLTSEFRRLLARLPMVGSGDRQELARQCGVTPGRLAEMLAQLRALDPRPGAAFGWQHLPSHIPELLFVRAKTGWEVHLNPECLPRLALDQALLTSLRGRLTPDLATAWTRARHLASALELRNRSVLAVGRSIAVHQSAAIAGNAARQVPLTRRMVATELGLHETTVGRIVKHASVRVEGKTLSLSLYFGRATAKDELSSGVSRQRLLSLIASCLEQHKDRRRPSDETIRIWLVEHNIYVARRTVAKYRHQLKPRRLSGGDP